MTSKAMRWALIVGIVMGSFTAMPVMAGSKESKKTTQKQPKIKSFEEYVQLFDKGKDKWTPQELKDLREYAFEREREGWKIVIPIVQKHIAENLPRALPLYSEELLTPWSLPRKEKVAKREAIGQEIVKKGGPFTEKELAVIYQVAPICSREMDPYSVPQDLLTDKEMEARRWKRKENPPSPTQRAILRKLDGPPPSASLLDNQKVNSD